MRVICTRFCWLLIHTRNDWPAHPHRGCKTHTHTHKGRAWKASELRNKSFTDLHALWYILAREKNALNTEKYIYSQQQQVTTNVYNANMKNKMQPLPARHRFKAVAQGMARIKTVLTERAMQIEDKAVRKKLMRAVNRM